MTNSKLDASRRVDAWEHRRPGNRDFRVGDCSHFAPFAMALNELPLALILLVHLHLLGYESRDGSTYNEDLFNPSSHGGGERIRTMEDVSFFLVGKIEGTIPRAKKVCV